LRDKRYAICCRALKRLRDGALLSSEPHNIEYELQESQFLPRDSYAHRGIATASRLSVCLSVHDVEVS